MSDISLHKRFNDIKDHMRNGKIGPTLAAPIVIQTAAEWESKWRKKYEDKAFETVLRGLLGRSFNLRFFNLRLNAASRLGGMRGQALMVEHTALVWLNDRLPADKVQPFIRVLSQAFLDNSKQPLSLSSIRRIYRDVIGEVPRTARHCLECLKLKAELEALRSSVSVPTVPESGLS